MGKTIKARQFFSSAFSLAIEVKQSSSRKLLKNVKLRVPFCRNP